MKLIAGFILTLHLLIDLSAALSVCDDVDIFFIIDKDSLLHDYYGVTSIVKGIVEDGSSEEAAFSLILYGDGLTDYQLSLQLNLLDTYDTFRANVSHTIEKQLEQIRDDILSDASQKEILHDISLATAFNDAAKQVQPDRPYLKKQRFRNLVKHGIGKADDENRYFIFDHFNKLLNSKGDGEICKLFEYINDHDDESIHFLMGQQYENMEDTYNEICGNKYSDSFHDDLFVYLDQTNDETEDEFNDYLRSLDRIFHLTCPAHLKHQELGGSIHLTAHNQWIDPETIRKCHLEYLSDPNNPYLHQVNSSNSYIYVNNHLNDGNTFKIGDHLIADAKSHAELVAIGCKDPIYVIKDIKHVKKMHNHPSSSILKLYVELPQSLMDYILEADINLNNIQHTAYAPEGDFIRYNDYDDDDDDDTIESVDFYRGYESDSESDEFYRGYAKDYGNNAESNDILGRRNLRSRLARRWDIEASQETLTRMKSVTFVGVPDDSGDHVGAIKTKKESWIAKLKRMASRKSVKVSKSLVKSFSESVQKAENEDQTITQGQETLFKKEWKKKGKKTRDLAKKKKIGPFSVSSGSGEVTLDYNFDLGLQIDGKFTINWANLFKGKSKAVIDLEVIGKAWATADIKFKIEADLTITVTPIDISKMLIIPVMGVPVVLTPYFKLDLSIALSKMEFTIGGKLEYETQTKMEYDYKGKKSKESEPFTNDGDTGTKKAFKVTKPTETKKKFTPHVVFETGNGPCAIEITITFSMKPTLGCKLYGTLGVEGAFIFGIPVTFKIDIPNTTPAACSNVGRNICDGTQKKLWVVRSWKVTLGLEVTAYAQLPNFVTLIGSSLRLKKLIEKLPGDVVKLKTAVTDAKTQLEAILTNMLNACKQIKAGTDVGNNLGILYNNIDEIIKKPDGWIETHKTEAADVIKIAKKRYTEAKKIYREFKTSVENPFEMKKLGVSWSHQWDLYTHAAATDADCIELGSVFIAVVKTGCCKENDNFVARVGYFDDWYQGYDEYNDGYRYKQQKQLNSAPVIYKPQSNNPFLALMLLDVFTIFVIMVCMCGCIGLICGAYVSYNYNILSQGKGYNILNVNEDEI